MALKSFVLVSMAAGAASITVAYLGYEMYTCTFARPDKKPMEANVALNSVQWISVAVKEDVISKGCIAPNARVGVEFLGDKLDDDLLHLATTQWDIVAAKVEGVGISEAGFRRLGSSDIESIDFRGTWVTPAIIRALDGAKRLTWLALDADAITLEIADAIVAVPSVGFVVVHGAGGCVNGECRGGPTGNSGLSLGLSRLKECGRIALVLD